MSVTRNCEYCSEPFTPAPGPMAAKQRFCCTKHRIYANRQGKPGSDDDYRLIEMFRRRIEEAGQYGMNVILNTDDAKALYAALSSSRCR